MSTTWLNTAKLYTSAKIDEMAVSNQFLKKKTRPIIFIGNFYPQFMNFDPNLTRVEIFTPKPTPKLTQTPTLNPKKKPKNARMNN